MATGTKIMRRNFAMKIGSSKEIRAGIQKKQQQATSFAKSTSEMVKSYINGTYKSESANSFWNELTQGKNTSPREENKGPLRSMRSALNTSQPSIIPVTSAGGLSSLAQDSKSMTTKPNTNKILNGDDPRARQNGAVASIAASRRLLRNSNGCYKIISNRRFGSSASSSCGSIFKRHDDRRRVSSFKRTVSGGFIERLYNTQPNNDIKNGLANISSSKYLLSLRNQNIAAPLGSVADAVKVSTNIQQDLMPIDKSLRERISIKNSFVPKANPEPRNNDPMSGWHHPPSPDMLTTRTSERLWYRRAPSNAALTQTQIQTQTKLDRSLASIHTPERYPECRVNSASKIMDKESKEEQRMTVARKPTRLRLTCVAPPTDNIPSSSAAATTTTSKRKLQPTQLAPPMSVCGDSGLSSEGELQPRKMMHMTARRINAVEHQPVRRFSLKRPPTANLAQITPPAPGPAAESLTLQQNRSNNAVSSRPSPMSTFVSTVNPTTSRYSHFNSRVY